MASETFGDAASAAEFNERFARLIPGRWADSLGNSIVVAVQPNIEGRFKAELTPQHTSATYGVLTVWNDALPFDTLYPRWRCGCSFLELVDETQQRIVWATCDGQRNVWSRQAEGHASGLQPTIDDSPVARGGVHNSVMAVSDRGRGGRVRNRGGDRSKASRGRGDRVHSTASVHFSEAAMWNGSVRPYVAAGSCHSIRAALGCVKAADVDKARTKRLEKAKNIEPKNGVAFPWLQVPEGSRKVSGDASDDILLDGSRVAALLDIRQMIGPSTESQERLTHILMDYDLTPGTDYLVPDETSLLWKTLLVSEGTRRNIAERIRRIPQEATSHHVSWNGDSEVLVGHHRIDTRSRSRDVQALDARWTGDREDPQKPLEIARILALYSIFDNPLSPRRSGVHLGINPESRSFCDYELFASPLNAVVPNGRYASKWPHIEWRFGSIGKYPAVLQDLEVGSVVCINPPFTDGYLDSVMSRLAEFKLRFRLKFAVPIQEASWRGKLQKVFPAAKLLHTYYDASADVATELLHPTIYWEDPRCSEMQDLGGDASAGYYASVFAPSPYVNGCGTAVAWAHGGQYIA